MTDAPTSYLLGILIILIGLSALFSSSETAMMSLNNYRLRHLRKISKAANLAARLLERPDRLIALILIGNNAINILASLIAGILFTRWFGVETGIWATTLLLTFIMLVFAEVTPKTIAAAHPERIAFPISYLLQLLMWLLMPFIIWLNWITNAMARLFGIDATQSQDENISTEELRTVVDEAGQLIANENQDMLLSVLDLEKISVNDIMIPRNDIAGLDLNKPIKALLDTIVKCEYTRLPLYKDNINNVVGILHLGKINRVLLNDPSTIKTESLKRFSKEPYFIPENTPLSVQLINFRKEKQRLGFIVDEYGDVEGMVTIDDLLEEIVGSYTTSDEDPLITATGEHCYTIDGTASLRDINKETNWNLPTGGAKTLNGLALEQLQSLPTGNVSFKLEDSYLLEATKISEKLIEEIQITKIKQPEEP